MNASQSSWAVVTGASKGIGLAIAGELAARGHPVALAARDADALAAGARAIEAAHRVPVSTFAVDLARPGAAEDFVARLDGEGIVPDLLVNNAGFGDVGPIAARPVALFREMLQLNVVALTELTALVLPGMIARRRGRILNVASTAAFQPDPNFAVYGASKSYVLHFTEALHDELRGTGVTATALCPGPTRTAFHDRAGTRDALIVRLGMTDVDLVAREGVNALLAGKPVVVPGLVNRLLASSYRFLPRRAVTWTSGRFMSTGKATKSPQNGD